MAASSIPVVRAALWSAMATAYAAETEVLLTYGHPGAASTPDMVALMSTDSVQEPGPMRTTQRTREETLRSVVTVSCWRGGGPEVQQTVTERAFALAALMEDPIRTDPTLGGACRVAQIVALELVEATEPSILATGRVSEVMVTIESSARV